MGMCCSGQLGDRLNLRILLTVGVVGTGVFTCLFGVGYWGNIHSFYYFLVVQIRMAFRGCGGRELVRQKEERAHSGDMERSLGISMGTGWYSNTIPAPQGSLIGSALLSYGWGWSFVVPGLLIAFMGLILFLLLPVSPESIGTDEDEQEKHYSPKKSRRDQLTELAEPLLESDVEVEEEERAVGFIEAWKIPGVAPFALCLFFAKLVAYTFLYWLPYHISQTAIDGEYLSSEAAGNLSTLFDVGGVVGGILAGHITDRLDARAIPAASFMYCAIPALFFYRSYGYVLLPLNVCLMFVTGMLVNSPYALITTAVSADLGTHVSLKGNSRALATVTAIIDGTGSAGAAIGPLLTGYISEKNWSAVFTMLMAAALIAGLLLTRLVVAEVAAKINNESSRAPAVGGLCYVLIHLQH